MAHANPYIPGNVATLADARDELVKVGETLGQIIDNQKRVQRDDGCLMDCAVVPHTLSDEVVRMIGHFELVGAYEARPYQQGQVVTYRDRMYVCAVPHDGGAVMDMAMWRLIGKAGCGCDGGGDGGGGVADGCAPKKTYEGVLTPEGGIDSTNGCWQVLTPNFHGGGGLEDVPGGAVAVSKIPVRMAEGGEMLVRVRGWACGGEKRFDAVRITVCSPFLEGPAYG